MPAAQYDFTVEQGTTVVKAFIWKDSEGVPVDLTGYTARMHLRKKLTTQHDRITLGGLTGRIEVTFEATDTIDLTDKRFVYDLELVRPQPGRPDYVKRLVQGRVSLSLEVTRD
jgi:hypothetical protein